MQTVSLGDLQEMGILIFREKQGKYFSCGCEPSLPLL